MRASIAIAASILAVASAKTISVTDTVDPTATGTWDDWASTTTTTTTTTKKADPVKTTSVSADWADWESVSYTTTTTKPVSPVSTTSAVWADWESTTLSTVPVAPVTTWASSVPVAPATTAATWAYTSSTAVKPAVATYTGAANANAGSMALAGLAAVAVMVIA